MNLLLIEQPEREQTWLPSDVRTIHLKDVLRCSTGELVDFGVINGPRGKGQVNWLTDGSVRLKFQWYDQHPSCLLPISLWVGLSRPQTCRKVLEQAAALGVSELIFFQADKSEPSYASSSLWQQEWRKWLIKGTEQAFACHLPSCLKVTGLEEAKAVSSVCYRVRFALDVYEADGVLASPQGGGNNDSVQLAIGPERGWSTQERQWLRQNKFLLKHMGKRVLRVETAVVAAVAKIAGVYWSRTDGSGR